MQHLILAKGLKLWGEELIQSYNNLADELLNLLDNNYKSFSSSDNTIERECLLLNHMIIVDE